MALLSSAAAPPSARRPTGPLLSFLLPSLRCSLNPSARISSTLRREAPAKSLFLSSEVRYLRKRRGSPRGNVRTAVSHLCEQERLAFDRSFLSVGEAMSDDELWAAIRLRVRTFYNFNESYGIEDYKAYVAKREFEGLKDRVAGKTMGFRKASCINATLPVSAYGGSIDELCSICKFSKNKGDRVVVGTLDINWCLQMPDELTGKRPEGLGADLTRAYLSNVCVAKELQRNGLGYALIGESKTVAHSWGITDLYVHVAVDNEAAQKLYNKSGFIYESEEPAWRARFLGRPRRYLLWTDLRFETSEQVYIFVIVPVLTLQNSLHHKEVEMQSVAACGGNAVCCQVLIARGASLTAENANGWTPLVVARSWHKHWLESILRKEPEGQIAVLPSKYLALPLMSIVKIARECGWRKTKHEPACIDPCAICLESKCTVAAQGCHHEFCTTCALYLCSTNNTSATVHGPPGSVACPLCRRAIVSFVKLPGTTNMTKDLVRASLSRSLSATHSTTRSNPATSKAKQITKPDFQYKQIKQHSSSFRSLGFQQFL